MTYDERYDPTFDPGGNWCPDCGLPRGVCNCEDLKPGATSNWLWWDDEDDWLEDYDYTEGDIGQDGEI